MAGVVNVSGLGLPIAWEVQLVPLMLDSMPNLEDPDPNCELPSTLSVQLAATSTAPIPRTIPPAASARRRRWRVEATVNYATDVPTNSQMTCPVCKPARVFGVPVGSVTAKHRSTRVESASNVIAFGAVPVVSG